MHAAPTPLPEEETQTGPPAPDAAIPSAWAVRPASSPSSTQADAQAPNGPTAPVEWNPRARRPASAARPMRDATSYPATAASRNCRPELPRLRARAIATGNVIAERLQTGREAVGVVEVLRRGHECVVPGRAGDAAALRPREQHRASVAEAGQRSRARRRHVGPRPGEARGKEIQEAEPGLVRHEVRDSGVGHVANRAGQVRGEGQGFGVRHV